MAIYNVKISVVDLIEAESPEAAIRELRRRVSAAGFEPYINDSGDGHAFESEPL